jgi:hypothetical protein
MNNIKEIKKMKMKKTALRALYGALTLSLIILGGCDQATDPDKKDTEEDKWETLLMPDGTARMWRIKSGQDYSNPGGCYKFFPNRTVGIAFSDEFALTSTFGSVYENGSFDGNNAVFDFDNELTITKLPNPSDRRREILIHNKRFAKYADEDDQMAKMNIAVYYSLLD